MSPVPFRRRFSSYYAGERVLDLAPAGLRSLSVKMHALLVRSVLENLPRFSEMTLLTHLELCGVDCQQDWSRLRCPSLLELPIYDLWHRELVSLESAQLEAAFPNLKQLHVIEL